MTLADFACFPASISHFYYIPIAGDLFVGALIFIEMCMLFVYRMDGPRQFMTRDVILTRIAGISAICVAIFPTRGRGCVLSGEILRPFFCQTRRAGWIWFKACLPQRSCMPHAQLQRCIRRLSAEVNSCYKDAFTQI